MKSPVSVAVAARRTWPKRVVLVLVALAPLGAFELDAAEQLDVHLQMARVADRPVLGHRPFELTQQLRSVLASYTNAYASHHEYSFHLFKRFQSLAAARELGRRRARLASPWYCLSH